MSTVLALESDDRRIGLLRAIVCDRLRASLVVADSAESAAAAISALTPDVVLVGPDFPPSEEIEVKDYLLSLPRSTVPQIFRVPAPPSAPHARIRTGLLGALRRRAAGTSEDGPEKDDFKALAARITSALERVRSARADASANVSTRQPAREPPAARASGPAVPSATGSPAPALTLQASLSGVGDGEPQTGPAPSGLAADKASDVADDDRNEWGLFDPSRCGYAALAATLAATLDTLPEKLQEGAESGPAEMLLRFETAADPVARPEPPAVLASDPPRREAPPAVSTCQEVPTAARGERKRDRPAPLALWAHLFGWEDARSAPHSLPRYSEVMAGVAAVLVGLSVPAQIAGVQYASGCRVHRVRGLARAESAGPDTFEVASSEPDSTPVSHPAVSESSPAA